MDAIWVRRQLIEGKQAARGESEAYKAVRWQDYILGTSRTGTAITWHYKSKAARKQHIAALKMAQHATASKYGRFKEKYKGKGMKIHGAGDDYHPGTGKAKAMAYGAKTELKRIMNITWDVGKTS